MCDQCHRDVDNAVAALVTWRPRQAIRRLVLFGLRRLRGHR